MKQMVKITFSFAAFSLACAAQADTYYTATPDGTYYYTYRPIKVGVEIGTAAGTTAIDPKPTSGTLKIPTTLAKRDVTSLGNGAFSGCSGITGVVVPSTITSVGNYAFANCSGLKEIVLPYGVTSLGDYAFQNCTGLKTAFIPILFIDRNIKTAFSDCPSTMQIRFCGTAEVDAKTWHIQVVKSGGGNYTELRNLADSHSAVSPMPTGTLEIPSSIGGYTVNGIGKNAFLGGSAMTGIVIPTTVTSIEDGAFSGCTDLTTVYVSEGDGNRVKDLLANAGVDVSLLTFEGDSTMVPPVIAPTEYALKLKSSDTKRGTVSGGGTYEAGATVKIKAKKKSGNAFGGWFKNKACTKALNPAGYDNRKPTVRIEMPAKKTTIYAKFITKAEAKKTLKFSSSTKKLAKTAKKATAGKSFLLKLGISSGTLPTVTAKGLPPGLSINKTTGVITGAPTKPGSYTATVTVKDAAGNKISQKVKITVNVPSWVAGTYNGLVFPDDNGAYVQFTIDTVGQISGKAAYRGKSYSFTSSCSSCTGDAAAFSPKITLGSTTFRPGVVTVSQLPKMGAIDLVLAQAPGKAFVAEKKFSLVCDGGALEGANGEIFTFTRDTEKSGLTKSGDTLRVGLKNDVARIAGTVGGKSLTVTSVPLFLDDVLFGMTTVYKLYVNILDYNVKYYKALVIRVEVNDDGSVKGVEAAFE